MPEFTYAITAITFFLMGVIVGWALAKQLDMLEQREVRRIIALVLMATYTISILADIMMAEYTTPILLHAIMGGIIGYLFSQGEGFNINIGQRQ